MIGFEIYINDEKPIIMASDHVVIYDKDKMKIKYEQLKVELKVKGLI